MRHSNRNAFTIVEALVALVVVGIAGTAWAASLAANGALRSRASARVVAGRLVAARIAALAARSCAAADTGGVASAGTATEAWSAQRDGGRWSYSDSISVAPTLAVRVGGAVACRP